MRAQDLRLSGDRVIDKHRRRELPFLAHEDRSRAGHVHGHQRVQETGSESALYDEPAKWCGCGEVLVEMKRIAVAAEFGESRHVFSGERQAAGRSVSHTDVHVGTSVGVSP